MSLGRPDAPQIPREGIPREFYFSRVQYSGYGRGFRRGGSWATDYPKADRIFLSFIDRLLSNLDAYESDLPLLALGNRVSLGVVGLPDRAFSGTVSFIDPVVDLGFVEAAQPRKIRDVLASREVWIKARAMRQGADLLRCSPRHRG